MELIELAQLADRLGVVLLLVLILVGGLRGWWVFGWIYRATDIERLYERGRAERLERQRDLAMDVAEASAKIRGPAP